MCKPIAFEIYEFIDIIDHMEKAPEKTVKVRICDDGNYHQGDLNRLRRAGQIVGVDHPDVPRGAVLVRVRLETSKTQSVDDISARPYTFHP